MVKLYKTDLFDNSCHRYFNVEYPWIEYVSISDMTQKVHNPFDAFGTAHRLSHDPKSKYFLQHPQTIAANWDNYREEQLNIGTGIHTIAERYFRCARHEAFTGTPDEMTLAQSLFSLREEFNLSQAEILPEESLYLDVLDYAGRPVERYESWTTEEMEALIEDNGWQENYYLQKSGLENENSIRTLALKYLTGKGMAGTPDMQVIYEDCFDIHDFKTDREIRRYAFKNASGKSKRLLYPLDDIKDCNFEIYSIKLALYAIMAEKVNGVPFRNAYLHHIDKKEMKLVKTHICPKRTLHAKKLILHFFSS